MKEKVSIVIPVYNVEKYLNKCLCSITNQTYQNIEIVCVNDCSTDNSLKILNKFKSADDRIKIFDLEKNAGVDNARYIGVRDSTGDYVLFVDSDDWVSKNCVELLLRKSKEEDADIVYGSMTKVLDRFSILKSKPKNSFFEKNIEESIQNPELFDDYLISYFGVNKLLVSVFAKLYKREILTKANIKPMNFKMGEDLIFNLRLHPYLSKISFISENIYFYRFGGMTTSSNPTFLDDIKKQFLIKEDYINKYNYQRAQDYIRHELVNCFYSHFKNLIILNKKGTDEIRKLIESELSDLFYKKDIFEKITVTPKSRALMEQNVDDIVTILETSLWKEKIVFKTKKYVSKLLC